MSKYFINVTGPVSIRRNRLMRPGNCVLLCLRASTKIFPFSLCSASMPNGMRNALRCGNTETLNIFNV